MTTLKFADTHNMVAFLSKPAESEGFEQIVDLLNAYTIKHALTVNPTIYTSCIEQFWATVKAKTVNKEVQLQALVDGKKIIITESTVSQKLTFYKAFFSPQRKFLIHNVLQCLSIKTTAWNEFSSTMDSTIICLATNQKFNFSKFIFESMVKNLDNVGKFLMYLRPKKKDTQVPQSSVPSDNVADEAVYKELDNSLVRAATTASSLEVEQVSGNINKTQSKATPNEPSSPRASSGGGSRRQETMGDTIAQTRSENVSKLSNDPLLARANEIAKLKRRVKKLENKDRSRTHKLKRLYKVGLSARVESSRDEEDLVNDDTEVFDVDALAGEEVFLAKQSENAIEKVVDAAQTITTEEITLAQHWQS
ncbi:hypothetical protein Tco_0256291 [Tanacetum coccineum]